MTKLQIVLSAAILAGTAAGAYWLGRAERMERIDTTAAAQTRPTQKVLYYRNPMNPSVTSPVPAKDQMGMDYVPVYADDAAALEPGTVSIDPTIVQDMGVRIATAERRTLRRTIRTVGRVDYDEKGLVHVNLRTEGWVRRLLVTDTGQPVRRGQALLTLYSPQIVSSEQEYLLALRGAAALGSEAPAEIAEQARALRDSSAERLRLLGVPEGELRRLQRDGKIRQEITLTAPASGIVQSVGARAGQFVAMTTEVYRIADLSTVWVLADLYENDVPWVHTGDDAELQLRGLPGKTLHARVEYVYPYLDGATRTQKVRLSLANPDGLLKPDMYADVTFRDGEAVDAVTVPEAAVVRSGTGAQVFVVAAPGRFAPRAVRLGVAADGHVQILDGLAAGETVVVSGEFLIDSESRLREAAAKMLPPTGADKSGSDAAGEAGGAGRSDAAPAEDHSMHNPQATDDRP